MPDYSKGKIYAIENKVNVPVCIGSTTQTLNKRWRQYRSNHKDPNQSCYNMKICALMREHGFENFYIVLLEEYQCDSRRELEAREGYHQRQYRDNGIPICNTKIEGETNITAQDQGSQWYRDHPEAYQQYLAQRRKKVVCKYCKSEVTEKYLTEHYQTQYCLAIQAKQKETKSKPKPKSKVKITVKKKIKDNSI